MEAVGFWEDNSGKYAMHAICDISRSNATAKKVTQLPNVYVRTSIAIIPDSVHWAYFVVYRARQSIFGAGSTIQRVIRDSVNAGTHPTCTHWRIRGGGGIGGKCLLSVRNL